ncbi:PREDICTED: uncharacterized protein LOC108970905 [Bactrocera latifrons]|uniref:uncharacterized protein LOC108970905 n=1 Tax=Bactrocera latifrons TaxID=174628 RepID=UPI0008DE76FE|nr:PREDICTED: uncharacterized protein LOC108970905 [Bactrocera latifrons]
MIYQRFTDTTVNAPVVKMRALLKVYITVKDNEMQTGNSPCLVSSNHTIDIGTDPQEALELLTGSTDFEPMFDDMPSTSRQSQSALSRSMCRPNEVYPQEPKAANPIPNRRYRKSARERHFDQKI